MPLGKLRAFLHTLFLESKSKPAKTKYRVMCFYLIENDMQNFRHFCKKKKEKHFRSSLSMVLHSALQLIVMWCGRGQQPWILYAMKDFCMSEQLCWSQLTHPSNILPKWQKQLPHKLHSQHFTFQWKLLVTVFFFSTDSWNGWQIFFQWDSLSRSKGWHT